MKIGGSYYQGKEGKGIIRRQIIAFFMVGGLPGGSAPIEPANFLPVYS